MIPIEWSKYISHSYNRVYVSPASGCDTNCVYCFIFEYGHPRQPDQCKIPVIQIRDWLLSKKWFRKGRNGTLISLAPSCEPFAPEIIEKTLEFVDCLSPLQNPIQLSTKRFVDIEMAERISRSQAVPGQIVIYVTITSFLHWAVVEPGSVEPNLRLKGLANVQNHGISTCLYIKPVLPGITEYEVETFALAINEYRIPYCAIGVFYISELILRRMKERNLYTKELEMLLDSKGMIPPPDHPDGPFGVSNLSNLDNVQNMVHRLRTTGAECVINGPCVMALSYDMLSPTGIWLYRHHMCVKCKAECGSRFAGSPLEVRAAYPDENPLPH